MKNKNPYSRMEHGGKMDCGVDLAENRSNENESENPLCPICGKPMFFLYGCLWDYDRWVCMEKIENFRICPGEIELETTTEVPE